MSRRLNEIITQRSRPDASLQESIERGELSEAQVALFTLFPTDDAWVREATRNGPTTRTVQGGAFAGVRTAG